MSELPKMLEIEPGLFTPLGQCSQAEVQVAAAGYLTSSLMYVTEALALIERHGATPISDEIMNRAEADRELSQTLALYAEGVAE